MLKITNYPQKTVTYLLGLVFPVRCIACSTFSADNRRDYLCKSCLKLIPTKKTFECIGCNQPSPLGRTCFQCRDNNIDNLFVVSDYKNPVTEKTVKTLKYRFVQELADSLRPVLKKYLVWLNEKHNLLSEDPIIIPVPLHYRRFNWRGFNQAEIIAKTISDILYIPIRTDILLRKDASGPQAEIKQKSDRLKNITTGFEAIGTDFENKTVILVDDVCTTGATLNKAATILKNGGAKKVIGFVIAKG